MKFAHNGKSVACGEWTSEMKTHFKVSIAHCSHKDKFNKKYGKMLSRSRFNDKFYIIMPAKQNFYGDTVNLKLQLKEFLESNC